MTGGCGFIGAALIKELIKQDNTILSIDDYSTSTIASHINSPKVEYHNCNTNQILHDETCRVFNPDIIYHLGEYSRIVQSFDDIRLCHQSNSSGTFNVLEYCREKQSKFVYGGSSSKFGNNGEDENLSPYAWLKSKNVELVKNYYIWWGLDFAVAYFYNVYGGGQITSGNMATVIGLFQEQYKANIPLTVVSPGNQERDFTHIDDVISGLILVGEQGNGDGYMIGTGKSYSILDVAKAFNHPIEFIPERKGERQYGRANTEQMFEQFGWNAKHDILEYISSWLKEIV